MSRMITSMAVVDKELEVLAKDIGELLDKRTRLLKNKKILFKRMLINCTTCHVKSKIGDWIFIQEHDYVPPFSCTGGDYWNPKRLEVCNMVCPKCKGENYIFNHPQKKKILELCKEDVFKETKERHKK